MMHPTHGYLPVETENGIGFIRSALVDMSDAEREFVKETKDIAMLVTTGIAENAQWKAAYDKLQSSKTEQ